jgi:hypothetical protein
MSVRGMAGDALKAMPDLCRPFGYHGNGHFDNLAGQSVVIVMWLSNRIIWEQEL